MRLFLRVLLLLTVTCLAFAQPVVDARNTGERVYAIVPLEGKGTKEEPIRPKYWDSKGIISYTFQFSDDGKLALVEFVASSQAAFSQMALDSTVKLFVKGKASVEAITTEFKKYKRDFTDSELRPVIEEAK